MSLPFAIRKILQALVLCICVFVCIQYFQTHIMHIGSHSFGELNAIAVIGVLILGIAILFRFTHPLFIAAFIACFGMFLVIEKVDFNGPILSSILLLAVLLQWHKTERTHYHQFKVYRWLLWVSLFSFIPISATSLVGYAWLGMGLIGTCLTVLLLFEFKRPIWVTFIGFGLLLTGVFFTGFDKNLILWIPAVVCNTMFSQIHLERTHLPSQLKTTSLLILSTLVLVALFTMGYTGFEYALNWMQHYPIRMATLQILVD